LLPNNKTGNETYLHKSVLDIYHWGAGLAVSGPTRDIGQSVLQSSVQTQRAAAAATVIPPYFVAHRFPGELYYKYSN
jgi:hypothetical protein